MLLNTQHPLMETIDMWQNYCFDYGDTAIYHYCIWWLASLYNDLYRESLLNKAKDTETIRSYAIEIARVLDSSEGAPDYLRAMAYYLRVKLESGATAPYKVSP